MGKIIERLDNFERRTGIIWRLHAGGVAGGFIGLVVGAILLLTFGW